MKLAWSIAVRFLKSGKLQTWVIILGIAIGVSVQVFIGSLISGLQKSLVEKTIGYKSQITVEAARGTYFADYHDYMTRISDNVANLEVISPTILTQGNFVKGAISAPVALEGFDFAKANLIYGFDQKIVEGRLPASSKEVAVGIVLQEKLGLSLGDTLEIQIPLVGNDTLTVVGFFDFRVAIANETIAITTLPTSQALLGLGDVVDTLEMQILPAYVFDAELLSARIVTVLADDTVSVTNWIQQNQELLSGLQGQSISSIMIQVFVMISVVLGIASVLAIIVMQKSKQIGILKAMGIQNFDASLIFLFEGLILGFLGAVFGVLLGLGLAYSFTTFAIKADGTPVVPLFIDPAFITLSAGIALLASLGASLIPARKSSRLSVIEVIRNA
jgi:lipoprotein-releasing system permease protein